MTHPFPVTNKPIQASRSGGVFMHHRNQIYAVACRPRSPLPTVLGPSEAPLPARYFPVSASAPETRVSFSIRKSPSAHPAEQLIPKNDPKISNCTNNRTGCGKTHGLYHSTSAIGGTAKLSPEGRLRVAVLVPRKHRHRALMSPCPLLLPAREPFSMRKNPAANPC